MANSRTFIEEALSAGRGVFALLIGDRKAAGRFDLSLRGLAGALIALLAVEVIVSYGPALLGAGSPGGVGVGLLLGLAAAAMQVAMVGLFLRLVRRTDGFLPFLVADFWASAFLTAVYVLLVLLNLPPLVVTLGFAVVAVAVEVNIARLIVTLPPLQVVGLVIAEVIGGLIALQVLGPLLGLPPELAAVPA